MKLSAYVHVLRMETLKLHIKHFMKFCLQVMKKKVKGKERCGGIKQIKLLHFNLKEVLWYTTYSEFSEDRLGLMLARVKIQALHCY